MNRLGAAAVGCSLQWARGRATAVRGAAAVRAAPLPCAGCRTTAAAQRASHSIRHSIGRLLGVRAPRRGGTGRLAAGPGGLFGLPQLRRPTDFARAASAAVVRAAALRDDIVASSKKRSDPLKTIKLLDELSDCLCQVADAAELAMNVCADGAWRSAALDASATIGQYIDHLNADVAIEASLAAIAADSAAMAAFSPEQQRFVEEMLAEFRRDGIHLPDEQRSRVVDLSGRINSLSYRFTMLNNSPTLPGEEEFFETTRGDALSALPVFVLRRFPRLPRAGRSALVPRSPDVLRAILKHAPDGELRREALLQLHSSPAKEDLILSIVETRQQLARALGYDSFARLTTEKNMAGSPEAVHDFLLDLSERIMPRARRELEVIQAAKQRREGTSDVFAWDFAFYERIAREELRGSTKVEPITEYLELRGVLGGIQLIVEALFSLRMVRQEFGKDEAWADNLYKFSVQEPGGREIGVLYLDLLPRADKYNHAAHFTVRCSRELPDGSRQTPIVALVCNLDVYGVSQGSSPWAGRSNLLLDLPGLETLFHEFGHALHSLLSTTEFQHLSGTRAALDFVELPSHWFEHFARDPRVLSQFALHVTTGQPVPKELLEQHLRTRKVFPAIDLQQQLVQALFDQAIYGPEAVTCERPAAALLAAIQQQHSVFPPLGTDIRCLGNNSHLIGYGAGYYSYLYAQVFAAEVWRKLFAEEPLSREAGRLLRDELLRFGGAKEPRAMLRAVIGDEPDVESLLSELDG